jgi:hypothetical protein
MALLKTIGGSTSDSASPTSSQLLKTFSSLFTLPANKLVHCGKPLQLRGPHGRQAFHSAVKAGWGRTLAYYQSNRDEKKV